MNCLVGCGRPAPASEQFEFFCEACKAKYPPSLLKAVQDPFNYACRLDTGEVINFESATIAGDYCTLEGIQQPAARLFERGLDVRVSAIVWCADAPDGS